MKKIHPIKFKNILIYLLSFSASACGILLNFVLARFLEANQFGKLQYLVALATTVSQFLILGMNSFLIREAKNKDQKGEVFNKCTSLYLAIVLFFLPIIYFVLKNILSSKYSDNIVVVFVVIMAILIGLNTLITSFFQGKGKFHLTILFENLLPKLTLLIISLIFIYIGKTSILQEKYLLFYIILYSIVAIPFCIILFKRINFSFSRSELKSIFFFFGVTITYSLGNNLTKVLQGGLYKNDVALGIISVSISIVGLVRVFTSVLDNMVKPIFSKKKREQDFDGLLETYRFDTRMNSYVSIPLYLFFMIHPAKFLLIFGSSYIVYPYILVFIAAANAIADITGPNGSMLAMTGKEKWELLNGFIYFGFYIGSVVIFSFNKIYGLTIALLIGQLAVNVAKYIEVWKIYRKNPLNFKTILSILFSVVADFIIIYVLSFLNINLWIWIGIGIVVGILCFLLNCFVLSFYRKKDFKTLLNLKL